MDALAPTDESIKTILTYAKLGLTPNIREEFLENASALLRSVETGDPKNFRALTAHDVDEAVKHLTESPYLENKHRDPSLLAAAKGEALSPRAIRNIRNAQALHDTIIDEVTEGHIKDSEPISKAPLFVDCDLHGGKRLLTQTTAWFDGNPFKRKTDLHELLIELAIVSTICNRLSGFTAAEPQARTEFPPLTPAALLSTSKPI